MKEFFLISQNQSLNRKKLRVRNKVHSKMSLPIGMTLFLYLTRKYLDIPHSDLLSRCTAPHVFLKPFIISLPVMPIAQR